jgi:hypothetical protein
MTTYGTVQAGRLVLRENQEVSFSSDSAGVDLVLQGQESQGRLTSLEAQQRIDDLFALRDRTLPFVFSQKPQLNGFYYVTDVTATYKHWHPENIVVVPWSLRLLRYGYESDTDMEAHLAGPVTRANDHAQTGERWHAPNINHFGYGTGSTIPSAVTRASVDGDVTVYRGVPLTDNPRWGTSPANALLGRCRFIDAEGRERNGTEMPITPVGWQLHNGIVRVMIEAVTGNILIGHWNGSAWQDKAFTIWRESGPAIALGLPTYCTVLKNDFDTVSVRISAPMVVGRTTVDFKLRRGGRIVEIYIQHQLGSALKIQRSTVEATTESTGYITATAADANGHKFVLGSSQTFTADNVNGGISQFATATMDAFIGVERSGAGSGDLALDLFKQYLGSTAETVKGVKR